MPEVRWSRHPPPAAETLHYETGFYPFLANYDVSPDGQRFLMVKASGQESVATMNVVLNWFEELKERVPAERK